ncbi:arginine--tRNA ligase [Helicobacter sp. MIT 05-5293]|uniref:arginine--tRNA ligase n=1 Tax=Helicobacter sp. MIT 05-5293 TaxID=1548149 RepID=UPI00051DBA78|nr:arginine--tRNA ligase [Helicobacter sp. MIT 05-5293]TLD80997.1 arginine--tRNA ligase [Helicobacter sp. MIT 05-5293]
MYHHIKTLLEKICECEVVLEKPKNKELGHFATPVAFSLAKIKRANPKQIAQEIASKLDTCKEFEKVEAVNGYINFFLSSSFLKLSARLFYTDTQNAPLQDSQEKILLEFVSANPTGPLHIGHARGAVYGDALARVGRHLGYAITTEYYINDAGAQIQMLGLSILLAGQEHLLKRNVTYPESYYRGEYIIDLAKLASDHFGTEIFESEDSIPTLAAFGKDRMLEEIKNNLTQVGINFDHFVSEKALYQRWEQTLDTLKAHQGIYESEGKVWIASSTLGDEKDRVIVRDNNEPTYLAGDIIYHQDKFQRSFDRYINIWGADHHGYIARVKAAIHFLGYDENKLEVLLSQMVSLLKGGQPYKMSKRAGNFILMKDVVEDIGADALRFVFLSKKADTHLEFDVDELKKQDSSNPIYYINYANARIHTLLEKSQLKPQDIMQNDKDLDIDFDAKNLLFEALMCPHTIEASFKDREIQKICEYLKNLAANFHSFYNAHKILGTHNEKDLLYVMLIVSKSITLGMSLLGIVAKTRM